MSGTPEQTGRAAAGRLRIGVVTHNYPPHLGGLETIARELTRGFAREHEVVVVTTEWNGRRGIDNEDGATIHRLAAWHGAEERGVPYAMPLGPGVFAGMRALSSCDILHAHGSLYATTVLALLAGRRRAPLFITEHVGFVPYSARVVNAVQRIAWATVGAAAVHRSARVIAYNSRVHRTLAAQFGESRIAFIPNGVDAETFRPRDPAERQAARARLGLPPNDVLALFVGRDAQKKNLDQVLRFSGTYRLVVCGAERTTPPDVFNLGALSHDAMPDVFAAADFLVHAAVGEGFPVTVQEAMASGLPVALLWDEGYAGSVERGAVDAVDSLSELAAAANRLAGDAAARRASGDRARTFALAHWNWNTTVARYLDLFRQAIGSL